MNEKYYIYRIKKGDHQALDSFIEKLYPPIYSFIYYKVKGEDIAKDLTQETFIRFIKALPTYHCEGKVLHYLYRIASHVCLSYWKNQTMLLPIDDEILEDDKTDVHETILKQMTHEQLKKAIYLLKPYEQDIIILKYFQQYTFLEISKIYQIPLSTVKTRHYQTLKKLKKILERSHYDGY